MLHKSIAMRESKVFPFIDSIYFGARPLYWAYLSKVDPVSFHVIENNNLVIVGANTANSLNDGLYLDCDPVEEAK